MQIIRRKADNVVLYLFDNASDIVLTDKKMTCGKIKALDINTHAHDLLLEVPEPPRIFVGCAWTYSSGWHELDGDAINEAEAQRKETLAISIRKQRDDLLRACDHCSLPDYPHRDLWLPYRQELRDLPEQEWFPESVTFPEKPVE